MRTNRREFLDSLGAATLAVATTARKAGAQRASRNVLVIVADDQGLDLGCYGNRMIQTPNLDRLASEGVRFPYAFTSTASCSASRSVILTGLYNHASGQFGHAHMPHNFHTLPHVRSLPRLLRDRGYLTAVIGKLHVQPASLYPFEVSEEGSPRDLVGMARKAASVFHQARDSNRPFYLHVGYDDPHRVGRGFGNEHQYAGVKPVVYDPAKIELPYFLPDQPEVRQEMAEYYQAVSRLDQGVGMLLEELRTAGQEEQTLVIYISDNGIPFPGAKATLYEPGVRLPMIVRSPRLKRRGLVNTALAHFVDLLPTCLDWAGAPPPDYPLHGPLYGPVHGRSLLPILDQENPDGWDEVFLSHTFHEVINYYPGRGIRTRRHKYIRNLFPELLYPFPSDLFASRTWQGSLKRKDTMMGRRPVETFLRRPAEELYDLEKDPEEVRNVAGSPQYAEVLATCHKKVDQMQQATRDSWWNIHQQRRRLADYLGVPA